jgi:hypothetical protein
MKKTFLKMALIKTDYEEGRLQPSPAGHPQLATLRANHFLLVLFLYQPEKIGSVTIQLI